MADISADSAKAGVERRGWRICLLGDDGVGESSLIRTLADVHRPTGGLHRVEGRPVTSADPREALDAGIATVSRLSRWPRSCR